MGKAKKAAQRSIARIKGEERERERAANMRKKVREQKAPEKTLVQFPKPPRTTM